MPTAFGIVFYEAINRAGMSANAFAKKVQTSSGYLSGIYSGNRTPPLKRVAQWADLLKLKGAEKERFILLAHLEHTTPFIRELFLQQEREIAELRERLGETLPEPPLAYERRVAEDKRRRYDT